jgi:hypothetical protein
MKWAGGGGGGGAGAAGADGDAAAGVVADRGVASGVAVAAGIACGVVDTGAALRTITVWAAIRWAAITAPMPASHAESEYGHQADRER